MRVTRAIVASLGTGMSLVLVGAVLLASVSTVVAFNGWPGSTAAVRDTPAAMLADASVPEAEPRSSTPAALVVPEAPVRRSVARVAAERPAPADDATPAPRVALAPAVGTSGSGGAAVRPSRASGEAPAQEEPAAPAATRPSATETVRDVGADLGGALDTTVGDVGTTLDPVSPTLGQTVDDVGQVVSDTVQGLTNTVADVLDGSLGSGG